MPDDHPEHGPRILATQIVYLSARTALGAIERGLRTCTYLEGLDPTSTISEFRLEPYDAAGHDDDGHGYHVAINYDGPPLDPDDLTRIRASLDT